MFPFQFRALDPGNMVETTLRRYVDLICSVFLPLMLFQYAQNSTDYALNYALNLPIMLELCPLFLEGANLYVQI